MYLLKPQHTCFFQRAHSANSFTVGDLLRRRGVVFALGVGFETAAFKDCFGVQAVFRNSYCCVDVAVLDEVAVTDCRFEIEFPRTPSAKIFRVVDGSGVNDHPLLVALLPHEEVSHIPLGMQVPVKQPQALSRRRERRFTQRRERRTGSI